MTDVSERATTTRDPLVVNGLYSHHGFVMIACNVTDLVRVMSTYDVKHVANEATELLALPGSQDWVDRMVRLRNLFAEDLENERNSLSRKEEYIKNLGEALRDQAIEHDLCGVYDSFADEWDLPARAVEYDVTISIRVMAREEEHAINTIQEEVYISSNTEGIVSGPEISAERVDF